MAERVRLGELLVEAGVITAAQLQEVLVRQQDDARRLGTLLLESGLATETQVTQILSQQLSVPWVSLYHVDFSRNLLNLVPRELAERFRLVPIFVRRGRRKQDTLYVAMDDPSDEQALAAVSAYSGLPVRAMIAPPSDVKAAIRAYYLGGSTNDVAEVSVMVGAPEARQPEPALVAWRNSPAQAAGDLGDRTLDAAHDQVVPESAGTAVPARESGMPAPKAGPAVRMITLTLLDGTEVALPARVQSRDDIAGEGRSDTDLTARDLVTALRASACGSDTTEVFGDAPRWERLFAALLSLLLKKHLIADWEFVEEYKKI